MNQAIPSLYLRLMKYQTTPTRTNLENYLTEGLCDLLNRMDRERQRTFLYEMLPACLQLKTLQFLRWETQVAIPVDGNTKYPDLIGYHEKKPVVVIEAKVGAPFTETVMKSEEGQRTCRSQLEVYDKWLFEQNADDGILILLSAFTAPPIGFLNPGDDRYKVRQRHLLTWQKVFDILSPNRRSLEGDFKCFLEEVNVAMDTPTRKDFSALELYLDKACERITHAMGIIRERMAQKYSSEFNWGAESKYQYEGLAYTPENNMAWAWGMVDRPDYTYVFWAVYYPEGKSGAWGFEKMFPERLHRPSVIVGVGTKSQQLSDSLKLCGLDGWYFAETDREGDFFPCIAVIGLDELFGGKGFTENCFKWVDVKVDEILPFL
ncbi:hypothetical protein [uncultured Pseudodesulfovibrio sp.]|uniref:hypothetical protein n=1 Tax=uncultured Pseudodesulfovibrio sp. TaxID=2035858 RepID=UPI0029C98545|nr:hypothetical protein [uncultured Pseudodesulfovibrio sp.]